MHRRLSGRRLWQLARLRICSSLGLRGSARRLRRGGSRFSVYPRRWSYCLESHCRNNVFISRGARHGGGVEGLIGMEGGEAYGLSTTNTSSSLRRPNAMPLFTNSFLRVSPSPSASPGIYISGVAQLPSHPALRPVRAQGVTYHCSNTGS